MSPLHLARKLLRAIGLIETSLAVTAVVSIVVIIMAQVFSRYVLGRPLIWAEELATYLLIWVGFLSASVALKLKRHIVIRTFSSIASIRVQHYASAGAYLVAAASLIAVILHVPNAMRTEAIKSTVGLPINIGLHWFFSMPTLIMCSSMAITALYYVWASLDGDIDPLLSLPSDPSLSDDIGLEAAAEQVRS